MFQDLRFALRSLRKRPGFSLVVMLTLALGSGANTAIFSVVNAVLLSPLPYGAPERLVALFAKSEQRNLSQRPLSYPNFQDWRAQNQSFEHLAAVRGESFSLTDKGEPERVNGVRVSTNILSLLGVKPALGRDFLPEEAEPGKATVALIGYGLWQRRYAGDPHILGQAVTLEGRTCTIIGVLPAWLKYPGLNVPPAGAEVWIPLLPLPSEMNRSFANMRIIGKLKPGVSLTQAQADLNVVATRLEHQYPNDNTNLGAELLPLREVLTGGVRLGLWILLGAVGCVLLIACVNVANLLLARAAGRQAETAIRTALGASRWRVMRQLLVECLLLSLGGGLLGLLLAAQSLAMLRQTKAGNIPRLEEISINGRVLAVTLLISCLAALLFGLLPALQATRVQLVEMLKDGRKGALGGALNRRVLNGLVVAEIALALVLLVGAGLLIRSFRAVSEVDPGFNPHNVLTLSVPLPQADYPDQATQHRYYENALARVNAVPGVQAAAAVFRLPLTGFATVSFTAQGQPVPPGSEPVADYRVISFNYFQTLGVPLLQGRAFTEHDTVDAADAVIVNQELAARFWPNENPVGKRLQLALEKTRWREVVGVVGNAKLSGLDAKVDPAIYVPLGQNTWPNALRSSFLVIRTNAEPQSLAVAVRQALRTVDPALAITQVRTFAEIIDETLAPRRFNMALLLVFAAVAGVLAAIGIYGVMSYRVAQRTNEIGLRLALGARDTDILKLVINDGARLTVAGVALGVAGAYGLTRLMTGLLYGVSALDPLVFVAVALLAALVALAATYLPARRAASVSPVTALRAD